MGARSSHLGRQPSASGSSEKWRSFTFDAQEIEELHAFFSPEVQALWAREPRGRTQRPPLDEGPPARRLSSGSSASGGSADPSSPEREDARECNAGGPESPRRISLS